MLNTSQNNEIENISKEISLLQDRLEINEKSLNQFKNGLRRIGRLRLKQGQKTNLSKTKNLQEALKDILKNKFNPIQDGRFRGCSRMGGGLFGPPPFLKSATHILQ